MNELDACIMNDLLGIDQTGHVFNDFLFFTNAMAQDRKVTFFSKKILNKIKSR